MIGPAHLGPQPGGHGPGAGSAAAFGPGHLGARWPDPPGTAGATGTLTGRQHPQQRSTGTPNATTYHPAFAYEALWDLGTAGLVIWAQRRFRLEGGRAFAVYAAAYTAGRAWIEALRVDPANHILGVRVNIWTSLAVFTAALAYLIRTRPASKGALAPDTSRTGDAAVAGSQPGAVDGAHGIDPGGSASPAAGPPHRPDLPVSKE